MERGKGKNWDNCYSISNKIFKSKQNKKDTCADRELTRRASGCGSNHPSVDEQGAM